jgi:hypothetical protein
MMFIVNDGGGRRVIVHRHDCALLDARYACDGARHLLETSYDAAVERAQSLTQLFGANYQACGWCRPAPVH